MHTIVIKCSVGISVAQTTFPRLRSKLVANKCQPCVRTAWPGNKTSIVSNWQNFLPSAMALAYQKPA